MFPVDPPSASTEAFQAALEAIVNPRQQLRCAVALQIGQLNALTSAIQASRDLLRAAGSEWKDWTGQSTTLLEGLSLAKLQQEELLLNLKQGWIAAKDEDSARIESALRSLASANQDLRAASEAVNGTGKGFQAQVQLALQALEQSLPGAADQAAKTLEQPIQHFRRAVRPLAWIGGSLGVLMAADVLIRVLK
jgi:hypothetical protein